MGSVVTVESNPGHDIGVVSLTGELVKKIQMKKKHFLKMSPSKFIESLQKRCRDLARCQKKEDQTKIQARKNC